MTTTHYALDAAMGLAEVIFTSEGHAYLHLPGLIVTESTSGTRRYLLSDGLGSVRQVTDEAGQLVSTHEYDPYGVPLTEPAGDPYGYTGEWWQADIGLLHLRARWYDPQSGTFLSVDPVESEPPYLYVRGNVTNWTDPSGNAPNCQICGVVDHGSPTANKARIDCIDLLPFGGEVPGALEKFLRWEAQGDPAALLTRVAMGEQNGGEANTIKDREYVMWIVRLRMEIAWSDKNRDETTTTSLLTEAFAKFQFSSLTGYNPTGDKGMVDVVSPLKAARGEESDVLEGHGACGGRINSGVYPCDDSNKPGAHDSDVLMRWVNSYSVANDILTLNQEGVKTQFPTDLRGFDSFRAAGFPGCALNGTRGNSYRNAVDWDENKFTDEKKGIDWNPSCKREQ